MLTVNAGTPWAVRVPKREPRLEASTGGAAEALSATETAASPQSQRRRRKGPERPASPQPASGDASASEAPAPTASDTRSQRGEAAKMPIAAKEWEYSAGPEDASSGREERRRKKAAEVEAEDAGDAANEKKQDDETPAYGPWIGKTKVSGVWSKPAICRGISLVAERAVHYTSHSDVLALIVMPSRAPQRKASCHVHAACSGFTWQSAW